MNDDGDPGLFRLVPAPVTSFDTQRPRWLLPIPHGDFFGLFAKMTRAASAPRLPALHGPCCVLRDEHTFFPGRTVFYDLFDVQQHLWDVLSMHLQCAAATLWQPSLALLLSLRLAVCTAMILTMACQLRWQRPFATGARPRGTISRPLWTRILLGFAVLVPVAAGPMTQSSPASLRGDWRRPADIELWSSGQTTLQEQLLHHGICHCLSRPLLSGGVAPPGVYGAGPPILPPPPPEPPDQLDEGFHLEEDFHDEAETFHISFWLCSPGVEHHSVDIAVSFPQSVERLQETLLETVNGIGHHWLTSVVPIEPQVDEDFGSLVMLPQWVASSRLRAIVLDGRGVGQGVFAFYLSAPITRFNVLAQLGCELQDPLDVYVGGSYQRLEDDERVEAAQGILVKVVHQGDEINWVDSLADRTRDPLLWDPDTRHPDHLPGRYLEFQTYCATRLHRPDREDQRQPLAVACETFGLDPDRTWVRAPTHRPLGLCRAGRRIHSVIAVIDQLSFPRELHCVVLFDLRPVGRWIQWTAVPDGILHAGEYVASLQLEAVDGYLVVVRGGQRRGRNGLIRVDDGEVLEVVLAPAGSLSSSTTPADTDDDDTEDGTSSAGTAGDLQPDSPDLPAGDPPTGPGPFGPPPPRPVNRPRSRSPQRERPGAEDGPAPPTSATPRPSDSAEGTVTIQLADHLETPVFSIDCNTVPLPHDPTTGRRLTTPWPFDWLRVDPGAYATKEVTRQALAYMSGWPELLRHAIRGPPPELHLYTDGSWDPTTGFGGFAVAIFLAYQGQWALFGACGGGTHGHLDSPWDFGGPGACQ